ncbi:Bud site selection protein bud4 [Tilletia horrida]|nr:Bud site selection protein bud4 [Tilletia horrida]
MDTGTDAIVDHGPPSSPEITTKQILGASSSGWSPQRQVNRKFVPLNSHTPQTTPTEAGLPRKSMAVLKHHSLVSNSIFLQRAPASMSSTAFTPSPPSPSKNNMGVGLGIGVKSPPGRNTITPRLGPAFTPRKLSGERVGSGSHAPDAENQAPSPSDVFGSRPANSAAINARKSKGIDALAKASFVSNSPFKQQTGSPEGGTRPLQPRNAWSITAEVKASLNSTKSSPATGSTSPVRPLSFVAPGPGITSQGRMYQSPDMFDDHQATPRSVKVAQPASAEVETKDSPATRSVLTSNRLHGPRQMSTAAVEELNRSERRKTVTFDEILEVQEFDKESSFDRESTRSASSGISQGMDTPMSESEQWVPQGSHDRLHVVNGHPDHSPASSASDELPALMPSTGSTSSDNSAFEETPDIPQLQEPMIYNGQVLHHSSSLASIPSQYSEEASYEAAHGYTRGKSPGVGDESFNSLTGLHRVDSLVDELLSGDILGNTPVLDQETPRRRSRRTNTTMATQQGDEFAAHHENQANKALPVPPGPTLNQFAPGALPSLPNWSPLVVGESEGPELEAASVSESAQPPGALGRPSGGRPRITRDAVLERVRAAKQEESSPRSSAAGRPLDEDAQSDSLPASHTHTAALLDADTDAGSRRPEIMSRTSSMPAAHAQDSTPRRPVPKSVPSYEARAAPAPSPIRHSVADESPLDRLSAEVVAEQGDIRRQSHDEGRSLHLTAPQMQQSRPGSSSGRASPSSMLMEPPPPVTPGEQADRIIARRRSKNGGSLRKRSLSAGDAAQLSRQAREDRAAAAAAAARGGSDGAGGEDVGDDSFFERHRLTAEEEMEARDSIGADLAISKAMLDQSLKSGLNIPFTKGMEREINRIYKDTDARYNTIDRGVIKGVDDKVQTTSAGDIDSGKAWRRLRRPSDMNEYAQELREIQSNNTGTKPLGKIFVLVDSFIPAELPVPSRPTRFYCVLDNGLHMVKTGLANLRSDRSPSPIGQEFELIQHKNLEFSFTLVAVRDPHLQEPSRLPQAPASPKKTKSSPSLAKGVSRLFGSPKKQSSKLAVEGSPMESSSPTRPQTEPMMAYMNREGAFGRTRVLFEELQDRCLGTCAIFDCAVMGVAEPVGSISAASRLATTLTSQTTAFEQNLNKVRGKLRLKIFYLPPIPSIPRILLPDSLAECVQGMRAAANQKVDVWMQGTLTQMGGDCRSWRRRPVQAQGMSLICFNEITKRPIVKIDLSKAVQIEDNFDPVDPTLVSPSSKMTTTPSRTGAPAMQRNASTFSTAAYEDLDENYHVERSFRITFADGERISFFTDTDEEKEQWLDALEEVVGKSSPTAPIWAHAATNLIRGLTGQKK